MVTQTNSVNGGNNLNWGFGITISGNAYTNEAQSANVGAGVTIGHIAIGCALGYIDFRFPELAWRDGHKRIAAWYETFSQRPSIRNTVPVDE